MEDIYRHTLSGTMVSLTNPKPEQINVHDMVYALSRIPRFDGHTKGLPYSVAQHSLIMAKTALTEYEVYAHFALDILLHDAHEYLTGDIASPVSKALDLIGHGSVRPERESPIGIMKYRIQRAIYKRLGLGAPVSASLIDYFDKRMLATEKRDILSTPSSEQPWAFLADIKPFDTVIIPKPADEVFSEFYKFFTYLYGLVKRG